MQVPEVYVYDVLSQFPGMKINRFNTKKDTGLSSG